MQHSDDLAELQERKNSSTTAVDSTHNPLECRRTKIGARTEAGHTMTRLHSLLLAAPPALIELIALLVALTMLPLTWMLR